MKLAIWSNYYHELSPEDAVREFIKNGIYEGGGFVKAYTFGTEVSEPDQLKYFKLVLSDYVVQK